MYIQQKANFSFPRHIYTQIASIETNVDLDKFFITYF